MSIMLILVSDPIRSRVNAVAYERPFSGVGIEFDPLGVKPGRTGITLPETGYLPANLAAAIAGEFRPRPSVHRGSTRHETDDIDPGPAGRLEHREFQSRL